MHRKKSKTAISRGSLPARHKSAKLFLLRKLSSCGLLLYFWNVGLSLGYHIIRHTSSSWERAVKLKLRHCGGVLKHTEVGCYLCVSPFIFCAASVGITWSCPGPQQYLSCNSPDTYPMLVLNRAAKWIPPLLSHFFPPSRPSHLSLLFYFFSPAAHYPWRLCGPFRCWAGWWHSDQHGESDNREWWLHGAIWGPEDDGRYRSTLSVPFLVVNSLKHSILCHLATPNLVMYLFLCYDFTSYALSVV